MNDAANPMETLFQSLRHLRGLAKYDFLDVTIAPASLVEDLIGMCRRLGEYDPTQRVGPNHLPLLHALSKEKEIPTEWLDMFAKTAHENLIFEEVDGDTIGSATFNKIMLKPELDKSPCMSWWIANVPSIGSQQGAEWIDALSRVNGSPSTTSANKSPENAQQLIKALLSRGASASDHEPGRPQERWSRKVVWWEKIKSDNRLEEAVLCPSGRTRSMKELMCMGGMDKFRGFSKWINEKIAASPLTAPHGRRKELFESWVLGEGSSIETFVRAQRLAASIVKTDGVLEEMREKSYPRSSRRPDLRPGLRDVLLHRAPSGMTLRSWFFISQQKNKCWPNIHNGLLGEEFDAVRQWWLGEDGSGIILQKMRAATGDGVGEFPGFQNRPAAPWDLRELGENAFTILAGDPSTHAEMVDLMVDALVAPSANDVATNLAEMVLSRELLPGEDLNTKLRQAVELRQLRYCARNADAASRYGTASNKDKASIIVARLNDDLDGGNWAIPLSGRDWSSLFNEWKLGPGHQTKLGLQTDAQIARALASLGSMGDRLAMAESTAPVEHAPGLPVSRPRL